MMRFGDLLDQSGRYSNKDYNFYSPPQYAPAMPTRYQQANKPTKIQQANIQRQQNILTLRASSYT